MSGTSIIAKFSMPLRINPRIIIRVMTLDLSQKFVTAQYVKNKWMEVNRILHTL